MPRWRESDVFTPLERDVMEYAEAMSQTPPTVTDELSARLLEALGAPALVELTAFIALGERVHPDQRRLRHRGPGVRRGLRAAAAAPSRRGDRSLGFVTTTRSSPTAACSSRSPTRCSAPPPTPRTSCRRPGCGGPTSSHGRRCATRAPTWCGSSPGRRSTGCARWPGGGRTTSASGCPSRC